MATRMKEKYLAEAVPALQQKFGYKNVMEIPKLEKIVINMGLGAIVVIILNYIFSKFLVFIKKDKPAE